MCHEPRHKLVVQVLSAGTHSSAHTAPELHGHLFHLSQGTAATVAALEANGVQHPQEQQLLNRPLLENSSAKGLGSSSRAFWQRNKMSNRMPNEAEDGGSGGCVL